jgi:hypothetical protein
MKISNLLLISAGAVICALPLNAEPRIDDAINYADGELNTVSQNIWRIRQSPFAVVENNSIVVDYTQGLNFNGGYQVLWPPPVANPLVFASFKLTVTVAPEEEVGYSFTGIADADNPDLYRARIWMKKGNAPGTFRLGMSIQSAQQFDEFGNPNFKFFPANLKLNEEYFIASYWDNENLVARLFIDTNSFDEPRVELTGGTPRANGFRRFGITMNSDNHLGRYEIRNVKVGENWDVVQQPFTDKGGFELDPVPGESTIWPESSFPAIDGVQFVAIGLIKEIQWPWIYSFSLGSWVSVSAESTLDSMYLYNASSDQWLWSRESLNGWFYNFSTEAWDYVAE